MCDALVWPFDAITSINWLEFIKALAPVATAIIALIALRNWQRQDKAKREAEFLDALVEAMHTYIAEMPKPITFLQGVRIGMASHAPTWENGESAEKAIKGAIAYIKKYGEHDAKKLLEILGAVQPTVIKLRSLAAKGQVFNFKDYAKCHNAIAELTWHFDRLEAFAFVIRSSTLNWEHPEVLDTLKNVMGVEPDGIGQSLNKNNVALIEFARDTYKRIYG